MVAIIALSLVPLAGVMGMAFEGSNWFLNQRAQQNAADSAVVAAANMALNDYYTACAAGSCSWGSNYPTEGQAVAVKYGYTTGSGSVTVAVSGPNSGTPVACPANVSIKIGGSALSCFQVSVTRSLPLYLSHLVGFNGNRNTGVQWISASAIAGPVTEPANICLLTLGWDPSGYAKYAMTFHGSSGVNLAGCPVGTNGGMDCTGQSTLNSPFGVSGDDGSGNGIKKGCGDFFYNQSTGIADPYASLASNIPKDNCSGNYPGTTSGAISASSGTPTGAAVIQICGNLKLTGDLTITGDEVLVIQGGYLDLAGHNFTTSGTGAGVTVVFTSPSLANAQAVVGATGGEGYIYDSSTGGSLNISSNPAGSGVWQGITVYQDPTPWSPPDASKETSYGSTWDGNSAKLGWKLSGVYYLPNANITLNGATDKASDGYNCFDMVINSIDSNGGNGFSMFANPLSQCGQQGSATPHVLGFRYALVG